MNDFAKQLREYMKSKHEKELPLSSCEEAFNRANLEGRKQKWTSEQIFGAAINLLKNTTFSLKA